MPVQLVERPKPVGFFQAKMLAFLTGEMNNEANIHLLLRNRITATWKNEKPEFVKEITRAQNRVTMQIKLSGTEHGVNKYIWVGFGTQVRYAHMTTGFKAKTKRGFIGSSAGAGGFSHLGLPLPGIKARLWDETIARQRQKKEHERVKKAVDDALFD